jgi:putative two-component system response regulator
MTETDQASVMVVDDQPANLKLLEDMLKNQGYAIRSFPRGQLALASAAQSPPDLILLDINMPQMNGIEVCERLKSDRRLAGIPVIFLSALNESEDKIKAFRSGGVDYVTKPFQSNGTVITWKRWSAPAPPNWWMRTGNWNCWRKR